MKYFATLVAAGLACVGCVGGNATASAEDEAKYKNPQPVDMSKIPEGAIKPSGGPAYIGEPSGASGGGGSAPPAASGNR